MIKMRTDFSQLPVSARNRVVDSANLKLVAAVFAVVALLWTLMPGSADATVSRGKLHVYSGTTYTGKHASIETMSDNRGWCITLPFTARSLANKSGRKVDVYESSRCAGPYRKDDIAPGQWVRQLTFPVRSVRIY